MTSPADGDAIVTIDAVPLLEPRGGVPPVIDYPTGLRAVASALAAGTGPVAVDAERASGYRYGQRAYLVQLRREGAGSFLIDPVGCPDLSEISAAISDAEWVLHAANQDLPCLAELGMRPTRLFDTELAARLGGYERVGLATMAELLLGQQLAKEHSAVDWSKRPLPEPWLRYAALDVEILVDLRDRLEAELERQGKLAWALEEFAAIAAAPPAAPRVDPWRRTSGMHRVRSRRQLAVVRALWTARDELARARDIAPGRVLPDAAIVAAALADPTDEVSLSRVPGWGGRMTRRLASQLWPLLKAARELPEAELPRSPAPGDGPPAPNRWADRDPAAAARLVRTRAAVAALAEEHGIPVENLLLPDLLRRVTWAPPAGTDVATLSAGLADALAAGGARPWQVQLMAPTLAEAYLAPDPPPENAVAADPGGEPAPDDPAG